MATDTSKRAPNRLAKETSPYLLQHAHNPVDWYAWGPEALERAKREDKPIFLSIGYSACHWCHVMERESFEDETVAKALNADFISIKVDREERPDIDALYMTATVAMSGGGGWPMSVFLAPDGRPFFAGTYFPKTSKYGRPGFTDILGRIRELWKSQRDELLEQADELVGAIQAEASADPPRAIDGRAEQMAAEQLVRGFDEEWGGFGGAPKFPAPGSISLLLRQYVRTKETRYLQAALVTLDRMARGGMYDQIGGGFARYSTDEKWHVPHFEKMLYDNAQLARVYVEAWQVTGDRRHRAIAEETLDYVLREMVGDHGGYFSATDADSEGVEGKFFVWDKDEIEALLPEDEAAAVIAAYDVRPRGNWEGHNVLWIPLDLDDVSKEIGIGRSALDERLARGKKTLYEARQKRVAPHLDDKVLVSWNALMIGTMAFAGRSLGAPRFVESAARAARMIADTMLEDGKLLRTFREGKAHIEAFLEDYAFLSDALVDLYEANGDAAVLTEALRLAELAASAFKSDEDESFCTTAKHHEALVVRMREATDNATPSANAILARALVRLSSHFGRDDLRALAEGAVRAHGRAIARAPRAFAATLDVVGRLVEPPIEIALVGAAASSELTALDAAVGRVFLPSAVIARLDPAKPGATPHPLTEGKTLVDGKPAAYVCRNFACRAPVTTPEALGRELEEAAVRARDDRAESLDIPRLGQTATAAAAASFLAADAPKADVAGVPVHRGGVLVAGYRESDVALIVRRALELGRNLIAFDPQRASAVGDAIDAALREPKASGRAPSREALVFAGMLLTNEPWNDVVQAARRMAADARLTRLDVLLVPFDTDTSETVAETLTHLAAADVASQLGVVLDEPLDEAKASEIDAKLPPSARIIAAPFNLLEGEAAAVALLASKQRTFVALRPLEARASAPGGGTHVVHIAEAADTAGLPEAPPLVAALGALASLEDEYRKTIAVHLQVQGDVDLDPKDLLRWSEELARADKGIDDLLEAEAFVAQSVTPALRAQLGALSGIGGQLAPVVESLRDRYLEAIDRALKALARRVVTRQAAMTKSLATAVGSTPEAGALGRLGMRAVLDTPGVTAALVTCRNVVHVDASHVSAVDAAAPADVFSRARATFKRG
ncbi:MAG: thioredoxin domain-containing protein [Polyangiaceae bacterium]|nr:thioredoxin domain-containing protein [Polyangiaceae bacterium]